MASLWANIIAYESGCFPNNNTRHDWGENKDKGNMPLQNLFIPYANIKGADQPAHPSSLISTFIVRCLDSIIPLLAIAELSRLYLDSSAEQAGLSLNWSQIPKTCLLVMGLKVNHKKVTRNTLAHTQNSKH